MALHTVSQLKYSVASMLSGIDISNVDDLNGALERAAAVQIQKADIPEASGVQNITLYSGCTNYACDPRVFGTEIKDIRPQGISRTPLDFVYKKPSDQFDRIKGFLPNGTLTTFEYANGVPIIRIVSVNTIQKNVLDQMTATTGWTLAGSGSALTQDTAVYYQSPASLRFTLTGASTGTLTKTLTSTNLLSYQGVGMGFLAIRIPDGATATNLSSISLKIGSDSSNYSLVTATTGFLGAWVAGNWLLVNFDFSTATTTGTPNWSAIAYTQVSFTTLGTFTNFRVGGLWISQPFPAQIYFQSAAIFIPSGSTTAQTTITADTDTIILNDPAYAIYQHEAAISVLQQTSGGLGDSMTAALQGTLNGSRARNGQVLNLGLYDLFKGKNPSESLSTTGNYYDDGSSYGGSGGY